MHKIEEKNTLISLFLWDGAKQLCLQFVSFKQQMDSYNNNNKVKQRIFCLSPRRSMNINPHFSTVNISFCREVSMANILGRLHVFFI